MCFCIKFRKGKNMKDAGFTIISLYLCLILLCIGCAGQKPPSWIHGKLNNALYYYDVGGPVDTMDEAKLKAREDLARSIEVTVVEKGVVELVAEEKGDVIKSQAQPNSDFFELAGKLAFYLAAQLDPDLAKTGVSHSIGVSAIPPADPVVEMFKRALQFQAQGQIDEAIKLYLDGLKIDPNRAEAYNNLGICYRKKKQIPKAQEAYEMAIRLKPRFPEVYNNLGWLLLETGDIERAIAQFQKGLELAPKKHHIWENLAWAYHVKGDYQKAIETNEAILQEYPLALYPRYNLALAYLCKGDIDAAKREYKTAYNQTSRPDEPAYQSAVDDLRDLLKSGGRSREAQRVLEILKWRK